VKKLPNGIEFGPWKFQVTKSHIMNSTEMDSLSKELGLPLPEMVFGGNSLLIENKFGFSLSFQAKAALKLVNNHNETLKVSYADIWKNSKAKHTLEKIKDVVKPYDWTFTTKYAGDYTSISDNQEPTITTEEINLDILRRPDPILFYDEIVLFEDELADNGISKLNIRIRVMPGCFFVLLRFFLRVDNVLVRFVDSRFFHEFHNNYLIHEQTIREASYQEILEIKKEADQANFANIEWLYSIIPITESKALKVIVKK